MEVPIKMYIQNKIMEDKNVFCKSYMSCLQLLPYVRNSDLCGKDKFIFETYFNYLFKYSHNSRPYDKRECDIYYNLCMRNNNKNIPFNHCGKTYHIEMVDDKPIVEQLNHYIDAICDEKLIQLIDNYYINYIIN